MGMTGQSASAPPTEYGLTNKERLKEELGPLAEDFEAAEAKAENQAQRDAYAILAALARGDPVPKAAAERVEQRAKRER